MTESILQEAERIINGDRAEQYGDAAESFADIAKRWTIELDDRLSAPVTAVDVARMMTQLKMSRSRSSYHRDSYVDGAGYLGLTDRLVDTVKAEPVPRVWNKIRQVPADVWVKDCEGDKFIWRDRKLYYGSPPWGDVSIHFDNGLGPFTEVIDD
ncbi:DUF6378 domain-containing protein [Mycobacteroides abscessus subsp. abscessus]|uniref:DUF6378 domain-containing protein n=1 Tax=Mycobacteroides abscessus TaxID=36809 RepID=UPI00266CA63E|nr:DUF6378 domain-containing protein [Mycobacteroides abscessus]MDO3120227.1 DUF6378 domain-containing protein [Mycobacteroides abscessus subsp. abscessus]MDO3324856.1 DUF6378 domain-containing protein [Mycobacteroides abscessus subsp. abscessus]